eukprot:TRINITY_DN2067_c0_g1_i5.p1 TRINITY_DN2067_c0_g1~~TRINITY_DN2067_c0_g1_i5.p1  ORF type:complete len:313 (+),score=67.21 TRINITY_DN2067_c0_g1_i5:380-1318(+)
MMESYPDLYVFYPTINGLLVYTSFDGKCWKESCSLNTTSYSSTVIELNKKLQIIHTPFNKETLAEKGTKLRSTLFDGKEVTHSTPLYNTTCFFNPSSITFKDITYVFYQGKNNQITFISSEEGVIWSEEKIWCNTFTQNSPSVVIFKDELLVFLEQFGTEILYTKSKDGIHWETPFTIPDVFSSYGPKAIVFKNSLYVFNVQIGRGGELWYLKTDNGKDWTVNTQIAVSKYIQYQPSVVVYQDTLYVFVVCYFTHQILYLTTKDGKTWSKDKPIPNSKVVGNIAAFAKQLLYHTETETTQPTLATQSRSPSP